MPTGREIQQWLPPGRIFLNAMYLKLMIGMLGSMLRYLSRAMLSEQSLKKVTQVPFTDHFSLFNGILYMMQIQKEQ